MIFAMKPGIQLYHGKCFFSLQKLVCNYILTCFCPLLYSALTYLYLRTVVVLWSLEGFLHCFQDSSHSFVIMTSLEIRDKPTLL
jgi:hypothetical protein